MNQFCFRSAPLQAERCYTLSDVDLAWVDDHKAAVTIPLVDVTSVRYASRTLRGVRSDYLDITTRSGGFLRLAWSGASRSWSADSDSQTFARLVDAIAQRLATINPQLHVVLGDRPGWLWAWFGLGLVVMAFGLLIPTLAIIDGVDAQRLLVVTPVMLVLALLGAVTAAANRPWRNPHSVPIDHFRLEQPIADEADS